MLVNADLSKDAFILPEDCEWRPSPMKGVERLMLDRMGAETGRATSIVRYAHGATFSEHVHTGGEEFLVLEGEFNDEDGSYPVGTYARNPIGTRHTPWAGSKGAVIFVKLHQFDNQDVKQFRQCAFSETELSIVPQERTKTTLHEYEREKVTLERVPPNSSVDFDDSIGGVELLVLAGSLATEHGTGTKGAWFRFKPKSELTIFTEQNGAVFYCKRGHLP